MPPQYIEFDDVSAFNTWHALVKADLGITGDGLVGRNALTNRLDPSGHKTTEYSEAISGAAAKVVAVITASLPAARREGETILTEAQAVAGGYEI